MLSFSWPESGSQELGELLGRAENHPRKGFLRVPHLPHALPDPSAWLQCPGTSGKCCWPRPTALLAPRAQANPSLRGWRLLQTHLTQLWRSCAGSTEHAAPGSLVSHCGWSSCGLPLLGAVGVLLRGAWSVPWLTKPLVGVTPGEGTPEHGEVTQFHASLSPFYPCPALPLGPPHPRCWRCLRG